MSSRISQTVAAMPPSGIRRFFDLVSTMEDVISLGIGEPDFVTPWRIREAGIYSLEHGFTMYTSNHGLIELREAIARDISSRYGVSYDPTKELLVTVGVSEALDIAMRALLNPGDEVILAEPSYVSYKPCVLLAGGQPVSIATTAENGFKVTGRAIERLVTDRTKALLLCYPNNPTGVSLTVDELRDIAAVAIRHDLIVIADEIYDKLTYDRPHVTISSLPGMRERTILLNGFSKAYAMTGWRLGYTAAPEELLSAMVKIHQYIALCAPIMSQKAAIEALDGRGSEMEEMVAEYDRRRRLIYSGLNEAGLTCDLPEGAFYIFPSIAATGLSSEDFAERLLVEERVAVVPGSAFGECGEGHVRCAYSTSVASIEEAIIRINAFVKRL